MNNRFSAADQKTIAPVIAWFAELQGRIIATIEAIEASTGEAKTFQKKTWERKNPDGSPGGGGTMALLHGTVMEKMGVNISVVDGFFKEDFKSKIPGTNPRGDFLAAGISLVAHPANPHLPAIHFNTRLLITGHWWFGGGIDLNPAIPDDDEAKNFHESLKNTCDAHDKDFYPKYKKWCDDYFYIKHRHTPRGVGGIFFDQLRGDNKAELGDEAFQKNFAFVRAVGEFFLAYYPALIEKKMNHPFTPADRDQQLRYRGRYAEFNLLYDRGTKFGLETDGNVEAILMSLPPLAAW
ncbi:MAG: oxygen-dependent coproporphyrinogen oxidase [Hydrotalea sp.]|nr:oxygen-dependent coproporphyrinogen oxidase [Hydrotalea sp.]